MTIILNNIFFKEKKKNENIKIFNQKQKAIYNGG